MCASPHPKGIQKTECRYDNIPSKPGRAAQAWRWPVDGETGRPEASGKFIPLPPYRDFLNIRVQFAGANAIPFFRCRRHSRFRWSRTMPIFLTLVAIASVSIFSYQKLSSPVVSSTLYALRTSTRAREYLGDEIYFKQQIPWIGGEMNQLHGRINIHFAVKGTKNTGVMTFASFA